MLLFLSYCLPGRHLVGFEMTPQALKQLRKDFQLSQEQVGSIVCRNANTIALWEAGKRRIDKGLWKLLLLELGVTSTQERTLLNKTNKSEKMPRQELIPFLTFKKHLEELQLETHAAELKKINKGDLRFIDLFAGIGGIRQAFERAGAKCVFSSEIDPFAQYTYYANHGTVPFGDITKINESSIPDHDILCAGFPCQPFSHIGKREGFKHPTQGTMFYEIVRILKVKRPRVVFLENVPGLVNHDDGKTLDVILHSLKELGYSCNFTILNAKDFGIPQSRARFYLVGFLNCEKQFDFPIPPMIKADIGDILETNVKGYSISEHLQKSYLFKKDDGRPVLVDKSSKGPMKTLVCSYHKIQRLTGTFVKDGETGVRLLTAQECKAVMGFPKDFILPVSRTQMYRQMGNSVVVKVIESIALKLVSDINLIDKR